MKKSIFLAISLMVVIIIIIWNRLNNGNNSGYEYFGNNGSKNMIGNGSFENGKDIREKIKSEGNNQIVILDNPGNSSYVLRQAFTANMATYYLLRVQVEPSEHYMLGFWYCCDGGSDLEETLLKLEIKDKNHRNFVVQGNTVVKEKRQVGNSLWYNIQFHFQTPADLLDNALYLYIGYNMTGGVRHYTNVTLQKYLTEAPKFGITDGLQVFLDGVNIDPSEHMHNMFWKDISEKGHDFVWDAKPNYQPEGYYLTYANLLQGPSGRELITNENAFSLGIQISVTEANQKAVACKDDEKRLMTNYRELIRIPGNNQNALRVWLPLYYGKMILDIADVRYETSKDIITYNNNMYFFLYNGQELSVYMNNALISTIIPRNKMHFSMEPMVINYNKNMRAHLHNLILYNRVITCAEIRTILNYLTKGAGGRTVIQRWFTTPRDILPTPTPTPISTPILDIEQPARKLEMESNCPRVELKNNEYWINIPAGSKLHKLLGYSGYKSYGKEQANAMKIYKLNFPSCPVPDILVMPRRHPSYPLCPYVVNDANNPCMNGDCPNVDWAEKDPAKMHLSDKCKRSINNYCEKHGEYDPMCKCWKMPYRNRRDCIEYRRQFLNPRDYNCSINNFSIEDHKDLSKYILKNRVPCFGCVL